MLSIRRLTKKFGHQTLSEVKPAPLSETVDHTLESCKNDDDVFGPYTGDSPSSSAGSSPISSSDSEDDEPEQTTERKAHHLSTKTERHLIDDLRVERVSSAEKRKYSQYKCSTGSSSSTSSSDDEVKEAFESYTRRQVHTRDMKGSPTTLPWTMSTNRPIKVLPVGCRKRSPKYFAQMSASSLERPFLDFNKMQHSKRAVMMVRRPLVLRHNSRIHSIQRPPSLEVSLDISKHSFQPVLTQT